MKTIGLILGILLIVAGITTALVSGLDLFFGSCGLVVCAAGVFLVRYIHRHNPVESDASLTAGRSFQRPLSPSEERPPRLKDKL